jgi:hypothetical protein
MLQPFLLELDGRVAGRFFESRGGGPAANEVLTSSSGLIQRVLPRRPEFNNIVLACGPGMSRFFYGWVGSAFIGKSIPKNGAVVALDHNSKPMSRLQFHDALVASLVLPELNKSQNRQAVLVISIKPSRTSFNKSVPAQSPSPQASLLSKPWNTSDFLIKISGLETDCRHVTRIQPLNLGEKIMVDNVGESREPNLEPGAPFFSDVKFELPKSHADGFYKWSNDTVKANGILEKDGSIEFLARGSSTPYFTVKLTRLGILGISHTAQNNASVEVSLYCESMSFLAGAGAIA